MPADLHTLDSVYKTCQKWWTIDTGGERESQESPLSAQFNDDDISRNFHFLYIFDSV